jgi:hypothetical protein
MQAMLKVTRLDIATLEEAANSWSSKKKGTPAEAGMPLPS